MHTFDLVKFEDSTVIQTGTFSHPLSIEEFKKEAVKVRPGKVYEFYLETLPTAEQSKAFTMSLQILKGVQVLLIPDGQTMTVSIILS